jgi:hypothetical protein
MRLERSRTESHPNMIAVIAVVVAQSVMNGNVHAWQ